jgi:hypothetical protein
MPVSDEGGLFASAVGSLSFQMLQNAFVFGTLCIFEQQKENKTPQGLK